MSTVQPANSDSEAEVEPDGRGTTRFALLLCALVVLFEIAYQVTAATHFFDDFRRLLAYLAGAALGLFYEGAYSSDFAVRVPGYSVGVDGGCDGIQLCALWLSAVIAFPVRLRAKLVGVVAGLLWIESWNIVRIASLVAIGDVFSGEIFRAAHVYVWPFVLLTITIGSWLVWARVSTWPMDPEDGDESSDD